MQKRRTTIEDLALLRQASDPQISPDGTRIVFAIKTTDLDRNRYLTHLWAVTTAPEGDGLKQLTFGKGSESGARWSPNSGTLVFVSEREDKRRPQLFLLRLGGGEAERVTDLPPGALDSLAWSPDGTRIAFRFRPTDEQWTEAAGDERKKTERSSPVREITRLHYREEGTGFVPQAVWRVHVFDVATRTVTAITPEDRDSGPPCWSPASDRIAVVRNTADDPDLLPNAEEIFLYAANGEGEVRKAAAPLGPKDNLAWSPSGAHIAYLGHDRYDEVWGVTNRHVWIAAVTEAPEGDRPARDLTKGWDVHCGNAAIGDVVGAGESGPCWSADGKAVLFLATDRGTVDLYRVSLDDEPGTSPKRLTEGVHAVTGFTADASGDSIALLVATPGDTGDLYVYGMGSAFFRRLTRLNDDLLDTLDLPSPTYFEVSGQEGHRVPCWAILPPGYHEDPKPLPTVLYIHGGPHLGYVHTLFHEYQALAAAGYVVLYPNPRGSKGYGEAFTGAIRGDWGGPAQTDCLSCVEYALDQGWTDRAKVGIAGGSYGGYLTGWMVGHVSDRFAAAVAERGVFNLQSMAGTCDFVWRDQDYFKASATNDPGEYLRNSPLTYADAMDTPLLIIHSEGDLRCPVEQAEQLFAALKRARKPDVVFLRYGPESNHNLSRGGPPDLRLDRQRRIHAWFQKYLKPEAP
ncbi:MAG: S9 family peptidase [Cytophagales bacterium]|nr:S9 family peptidase [Armatimonadota bacterium]